MQNTTTRIYSLYSRQAVDLLAKLIRLQRKNLKMTTDDLAKRAGISRSTLQKIENGNMKCEIGLVFEVAALVGCKLFDTAQSSIGPLIESVHDKIVLLPKNVRRLGRKVDDDF